MDGGGVQHRPSFKRVLFHPSLPGCPADPPSCAGPMRTKPHYLRFDQHHDCGASRLCAKMQRRTSGIAPPQMQNYGATGPLVGLGWAGGRGARTSCRGNARRVNLPYSRFIVRSAPQSAPNGPTRSLGRRLSAGVRALDVSSTGPSPFHGGMTCRILVFGAFHDRHRRGRTRAKHTIVQGCGPLFETDTSADLYEPADIPSPVKHPPLNSCLGPFLSIIPRYCRRPETPAMRGRVAVHPANVLRRGATTGRTGGARGCPLGAIGSRPPFQLIGALWSLNVAPIAVHIGCKDGQRVGHVVFDIAGE